MKATLTERIEEANKRYRYFGNMPFTDEEKTFWGNFIIDKIERYGDKLWGADTPIAFNYTSSPSLIPYNREKCEINDRRLPAFYAWCRENNLYVELGFNSYIGVYTPNMLAELQRKKSNYDLTMMLGGEGEGVIFEFRSK